MNIPVDTEFTGEFNPSPVDFGFVGGGDTSLVTTVAEVLGPNQPFSVVSVVFIGGAPALGVTLTQTTTTFTGDTIAITTTGATPPASYMGTIRMVVIDDVGLTIQIDVDFDFVAGLSFTEQVEALDPEVWWRFDEASGNVINVGNDTVTDLDLVFSEGEIGDRRSTALTGSIGSLASNRGRAVLSPVSNGVQDINGGSPAATGTFVFLWAGPRKRFGWLWENFGAFDIDGIGMRISPTGFQAHLQDGFTTPNEYTQIWLGDFQDTLPHLFVMAQQATGVTGSVKVWIDGVDVGAPDIENKGASISFDYWLPDQVVSSRMVVGGRGNPREQEQMGYYQELFYLDGVVITDTEVLDLWNAVNQTATANRDIFQAVLAINDPLYYWPLNETGDTSSGDDTPRNFGSESFDVDSIQGTPIYAEAGHSPHDAAVLSVPGGVTSPEGFFNDVDANKPRMASGYIHMIYQQPVALVNPPTIIGYSDDFGGGNDFGRIQAVPLGGSAFFECRFRANEQTASDGIVYRLRLDTEGVVDLTDGSQYQIIFVQNGIDEPLTWYIGTPTEQRVYPFDHANNEIILIGLESKDGTDWFADWVADGYINFAIGFLPTSPNQQGMSCHLEHVVMDDHILTSGEAATLYTAFRNGLDA